MKPNSFHARILKNQYLPKAFKFAIIMFANWLFHGFLYMDRTEKVFFLLLDGLFFLPVFFALLSALSLCTSIFIALGITHTLHWLFNGHLYVLCKNLGLSKTEFKRFEEYIQGLQERGGREKSILAIVAFGSLSRGRFTEFSDLDIRIIARSGLANGIKSCVFTFIERSRALICRIPLDAYTCNKSGLSKISPDEPPVIIYDPEERFRKQNHEIDIDN